uniref:Uncharacterized protein n=1 Tax=Parastrongyloides trichosuri TaxID=131310 RepID=A0A0N4Z8G6_PARTI
MKQILLLIALISCVPFYFINAEDDEKRCWTDTYDVVIYGQFYCNGVPYKPYRVSLVEYSGNWGHNKIIRENIQPLQGANKIYHHRQKQINPNTTFSVSMEVMHSCNKPRHRFCPYLFRIPIPTSYIDCHSDNTVAYSFSINLNSGNYRGRNDCAGPFGK